MSSLIKTVAMIVVATTALSISSPLHAQERESLLSCKFGPACELGKPECDDYDIWKIVRYYPSERRHTVFDALNSRESEAELIQMKHLMVLNSAVDTDRRPERGTSSAHDSLSIATNLQASLQSSFFVEFEIDDWRFYNSSHQGMCQEIN